MLISVQSLKTENVLYQNIFDRKTSLQNSTKYKRKVMDETQPGVRV